ncbi:hypothetical protein BOTNAR_0006g00630 [Botryotinia narcissicola]|uniref:Glycosyl hydrolase family 13 catalytic domain-containing protein n=1 Tax=Botryotinia narcissicola TaxID=278944 RepID=A0A4Z1J9K4_9HELO|nr:hypothetical protein BOTNAR_0006g00630 [Botryotinia narcissicola]
MGSIARRTIGSTHQWWKEAVVYQIYPASYLDTTGSGDGDLNGITSKLPYIRSLGVDVVWISPIYASPMNDMGYDISDYRAINPMFGTMEDWERLCARAHELGLKLVMDLVVNHTSSEHPWFKESVSGGPKGPKRDFYYWQPPKNGKEPNNWGAMFGGSSWEKDPSHQTDEYYLHVYDVSQPDLNWTNPAVRNEVWDIMRFWLDKGCDGFRMDVINCISKEPGFPDFEVTDPRLEFQIGVRGNFNGPHVKEYLEEMHREVLCHYPEAFTVGETPGLKRPESALGLVQGGKPLQMIFQFEHMYFDIQPGKKPFFPRPSWDLTDMKRNLGEWMSFNAENDGWDSLYLENHDQPRILGRWAKDTPEWRVQAAKMLALFHATGRGTLFVYQGQEIGTANSKWWTNEEFRDVEEINFFAAEKARREKESNGKEVDMTDISRGIQGYGRDNSRMGMQWDDSPNGGFTKGKPWIKTNEEYKEINVAAQEGVKGSTLEFWKQMIKLRKDNPVLCKGGFEMVDQENQEIYAYLRKGEEKEYLVACNFKEWDVKWKVPVEIGGLLFGSYEEGVQSGEKEGELNLRPFEGRIYVRDI